MLLERPLTEGEIRAFPKVELHLHLDCSLSYDVVRALEPAVSLADYRDRFVAPAKCTDLADFLERAPEGVALMQSEEQLRAVTADLFAQLRADGVVYAEVRFAPLLHTDGDLSADDVVAIVDAAARSASAETGVETRLILCTLRHYGEGASVTTAELAGRFRAAEGSLVAGFDIAADEAGYAIDAHVLAFERAHALGVPCTAHAGEARGAASVTETLDRLRPSRIGHGVRSVEDPAVVARLVREGVHLEVCPSSNVQTDVVDTYRDHPIEALRSAGVPLSVSTDARTITDVTLTTEYGRLVGDVRVGPRRAPRMQPRRGGGGVRAGAPPASRSGAHPGWVRRRPGGPGLTGQGRV